MSLTSSNIPSAGPLDGLLVLDLTRVLSGPYATMLLGDMGATVIKIEDPCGGDTTRHSPSFKNGQSHYCLSINRNKKSVTLDLSKPRGQEVLRSLCKHADVLIENFRPGAMKRFGLDYESLSVSVSPKIDLLLNFRVWSFRPTKKSHCLRRHHASYERGACYEW